MIALHHLITLIRHARKPVGEAPRLSAAQVLRWLQLYGFRTLADATTGPRAHLLAPHVRNLVDVHYLPLTILMHREQPEVQP